MKRWLKKQYQQWDQFFRAKATEKLEWEVAELENIFALLTLGFFVGQPGLPLPIALRLMPDMENEFLLMLQRVDLAHGPLSQLFATLDVG